MEDKEIRGGVEHCVGIVHTPIHRRHGFIMAMNILNDAIASAMRAAEGATTNVTPGSTRAGAATMKVLALLAAPAHGHEELLTKLRAVTRDP
jgi:hypothetical protein